MKERLKARESSFELLRLMSIAVIVIGHFGGQSFLSASGDSTNRMIAEFLGAGGRIAVNLFLLMGTWFMVDAKFNVERMVRMYLQVALYTIPLTAIMLFMGTSGGFRNVVQGFLPFFGRPLWFATAYISLVAVSPFLNVILAQKYRTLGKFVFVMMFVFSAVCTIPAFTAPEYPAELAWFVLVYLSMGWAKRTGFFNRLPGPVLSGGLGFGLLLMLSVARFYPMTSWIAVYWLVHLPALPNLIASLLIFNSFRTVRMGSVKVVNWLASSVFAVYVVHQVPAFREYEWNVIFCAEKLSSAPPWVFVCGLFGVVTVLILSVSIVDRIYRQRVQLLIEKSYLYRRFIERLRIFYQDVLI